MRVLAALATVPGRAHVLPRALESLRPHVDVLAVYLNGYADVPKVVSKLADLHVLDHENRGAERKLHWAAEHGGIYLSCDDDFAYPADYVPTMVAAVQQWKGQAIVTGHGRSFHGRPRTIQEYQRSSLGIVHHQVKTGRWVNHGGTGCMAWDTREVALPAEWPLRNMADMQVSVWAQRNRVPIWLVPHKGRWLDSFLTMDPNGLFASSRAEGHARRNALLQTTDWQIFTVNQ